MSEDIINKLGFDPDNPPYEYITEQKRAEEVLHNLKKEKMLAVDVESTSLEPYTGDLLMIQIGPKEISYLFDVRRVKLDKIPEFKEILENPKILKLLQNGKFDYKYIKVKYGVRIKNIYDTMLAEAVLTAGLGASVGLKATVERYFGPGVIDKSEQASFVGMVRNQSFTEGQLKYGGVDTLILFPIYEKQLPLLSKYKLLDIAKLEFAVTTVVGDMELKGVYVDQKKWREIISHLGVRREEIAKEFQEAIRPYYKVSQTDLFGGVADAININSQQQLMDLFNNRLGLNLPSTGSAILSESKHPIVKLLSDYRQYEKLISSFGDSLLEKVNPKTKRLHPEFQQLRAATGRFACNNPNIQQIPRNSEEAPFRECFNPEPGYKLVVSDYSSFEMRILADLSGDEKFIYALENGLDMHSYTASLMFGLEYSDDFKKHYPGERQAAKALGFGLMYGMGAGGLAGRLGVSKEKGQEYMDKYFASYPSVGGFLDSLAKNAVKDGYASTPLGRRRWFKRPDKSDPDYKRKISSIQRQAKNHPIQGTNADAIKVALVYVQERIERDNIDAAIILTVHDEIACEVREDQAEDFATILSDEMVRAAKLFITKVPVISEPFVGDVWEH